MPDRPERVIDGRTGGVAPCVSVVIPLYNRANLIEATLRSVLAQHFQDFEVVVIDDGSKDEPEPVIRALADPRIRYFRYQNAGSRIARNRGVDQARGTFIAFLDSDDLFLPHHLQTMIGLLQDNPDAVAYSQVIVRRAEGLETIKPPRGRKPDETMAEYLMCGRGFVQTSTVVMPATVARQVRYRRDSAFGDDTDYAIRLEIAGHRFVMAERPGVIWLDLADPDRLSSRLGNRVKMAWLEELRPHIPDRAYRGYVGWHVAKSVAQEHPLRALRLYADAVVHGAYPPRLAGVVLLQILLPARAYRRLADRWIAWRDNRTPARQAGH